MSRITKRKSGLRIEGEIPDRGLEPIHEICSDQSRWGLGIGHVSLLGGKLKYEPREFLKPVLKRMVRHASDIEWKGMQAPLSIACLSSESFFFYCARS